MPVRRHCGGSNARTGEKYLKKVKQKILEVGKENIFK